MLAVDLVDVVFGQLAENGAGLLRLVLARAQALELVAFVQHVQVVVCSRKKLQHVATEKEIHPSNKPKHAFAIRISEHLPRFLRNQRPTSSVCTGPRKCASSSTHKKEVSSLPHVVWYKLSRT